MFSRFVRPALATLTISHGDTLVVKRRLTHGERIDAYQRLYYSGADGKLRANPITASMALVMAYLVDWSITDPDGAAVPIKGVSLEELEATLRNLEPLDFAEIQAAIEAHEERENTAREIEKKTHTGETPSKPISGSPSAVDGALSGFVN